MEFHPSSEPEWDKQLAEREKGGGAIRRGGRLCLHTSDLEGVSVLLDLPRGRLYVSIGLERLCAKMLLFFFFNIRTSTDVFHHITV